MIFRRLAICSLALALALLPPGARACGSGDMRVAQDPGLLDLSWVKSKATLFILEYGAPHIQLLRLAPYSRSPIASDRTNRTLAVSLSPDRRWLLYRTEPWSVAEYILYDSVTDRTFRPGWRVDTLNTFAFSPDNKFLALLPRTGPGQTISVLNLTDQSIKNYSVPLELAPAGITWNVTWSNSGEDLLTGHGNQIPPGKMKALALNRETGEFRRIDSVSEPGTDNFAKSGVRYFEDGIEIGAWCPLCAFLNIKRELSLSGSVKVTTDGYKLSIRHPGEPDRVAFEVPPPAPPAPDQPVLACSGQPISLVGSIGDQYVLFQATSMLWIYGIAENRTGLISNGPSDLLWN